MTDSSIMTPIPDGVQGPGPDDENEALIDAWKTLKITVISAVLFCAAALGIILMTRMG